MCIMTIKKWKKILLIIALIFVILVSSFGIYALYRMNVPRIIKSLPDPFVFNDGSRVQSKEDWNERREEIKALLFREVYGTMPGRPDALKAKIMSSELRGDGSMFQEIVLSIIPSLSSLNVIINFTLFLYIPQGSGPFPAIVKVSPDGTGSQVENNQTITRRGYIYACYEHTDLDPDTEGSDIVGPCQAAYPDYTWGSIAVWAWGAMRVADYLLAESWVDAPDGFPSIAPDKLIVTGHSRRGKTALLAGAIDERFDMVVPNGSGCGGAGSFLIQGFFAEKIADITSIFTYYSWFNNKFREYAGRESELPFDQHFLRALVAPRLILSTDAMEDYWANPVGTQAIYEATDIVYQFLGLEENNAIHYRHGGHGFTAEDFTALLGFADKMLLEKDISGDFYMTPYDVDFPIYFTAPS